MKSRRWTEWLIENLVTVLIIAVGLALGIAGGLTLTYLVIEAIK